MPSDFSQYMMAIQSLIFLWCVWMLYSSMKRLGESIRDVRSTAADLALLPSLAGQIRAEALKSDDEMRRDAAQALMPFKRSVDGSLRVGAQAPSPAAPTAAPAAPRIVIVNTGTPQKYETESISREEIRLIAKDMVAKHAGSAVSRAVTAGNDGLIAMLLRKNSDLLAAELRGHLSTGEISVDDARKAMGVGAPARAEEDKPESQFFSIKEITDIFGVPGDLLKPFPAMRPEPLSAADLDLLESGAPCSVTRLQPLSAIDRCLLESRAPSLLDPQRAAWATGHFGEITSGSLAMSLREALGITTFDDEARLKAFLSPRLAAAAKSAVREWLAAAPGSKEPGSSPSSFPGSTPASSPRPT